MSPLIFSLLCEVFFRYMVIGLYVPCHDKRALFNCDPKTDPSNSDEKNGLLVENLWDSRFRWRKPITPWRKDKGGVNLVYFGGCVKCNFEHSLTHWGWCGNCWHFHLLVLLWSRYWWTLDLRFFHVLEKMQQFNMNQPKGLSASPGISVRRFMYSVIVSCFMCSLFLFDHILPWPTASINGPN